jgi:hypothetical protein
MPPPTPSSNPSCAAHRQRGRTCPESTPLNGGRGPADENRRRRPTAANGCVRGSRSPGRREPRNGDPCPNPQGARPRPLRPSRPEAAARAARAAGGTIGRPKDALLAPPMAPQKWLGCRETR